MPDDALGTAMLDRVRGCLRAPCIYRDGDDAADAHIVENYLVPPEEWPDAKWEFLDSLRTPMLDVGCGAGQHALAVQERGDVVAFDVSPNAVRAARERGVGDAMVADMFSLPFDTDARFETVLANGTQTGLAGSLDGIAELLDTLASLTTATGDLVVDSYDPTRLSPGTCFGYRDDPRDGLARRQFHVEYGDFRGPTLDFLLCSPERLESVAAAVGLDVCEVVFPNEESAYYRMRLRR
ncbi:class I SAM-dependent methyltransferase [Haloferax namakaokahaiae]|uniref:Class I SAM-dependent methyltransferase n=1 Tax=Haloferax namakaokahaiae TaxID=1748331 RepID=A0ABD5ZF37_9EURY